MRTRYLRYVTILVVAAVVASAVALSMVRASSRLVEKEYDPAELTGEETMETGSKAPVYSITTNRSPPR